MDSKKDQHLTKAIREPRDTSIALCPYVNKSKFKSSMTPSIAILRVVVYHQI